MMRGCVGVAGGWLCPIRTPRSDEVTRVRSSFSGHYQCLGLNVQAYCGHRTWFTSTTCSGPGGSSDAMAYIKWGLSKVVDKLPRGLQIMGENAYVNSCKLLTPFPQPKISTAFHDSYNFHSSQLRIRIEMAFGPLVRKWRIFRSPFEVAFKKPPRVILAAYMLHNWCIDDRLASNPDYTVEVDDDFVEVANELTTHYGSILDVATAPNDC